MSDLIDVAGLRTHLTSALSDAALQDIIDYNDAAIIQRVGPIEEHATLLFPRDTASIIQVGTPAEILSVTEWKDIVGFETVLDETDYWNTKGTLRRRGDGSHPYTYWNAPVELIWNSSDDFAIRKMVLVQLCKLDNNRNPGLTSFTVGEHSEAYGGAGNDATYDQQREAILGQLVSPEVPPVFA